MTTVSNDIQISVLLSTRNRALLVDTMITEFCKQEDLGNLKYELIIVDNASTDETTKVLEQTNRHIPLVSLYEPELGKNRALNRALHHARGDLVVFTDDDVKVCRTWLAEIARASLAYPEADVFCGPVEPEFLRSPPASLERFFEAYPIYEESAFAKFSLNQPESITNRLPFGPNFAVRRRALSERAFNPNFGPAGDNYIIGGETELLLRLKAAGAQTMYLPEASVKHLIRPEQVTIDWLQERAYKHGRGRFYVDVSEGSASIRSLLNALKMVVKSRILSSIHRSRETIPGIKSRLDLQFYLGWIREYLHALPKKVSR